MGADERTRFAFKKNIHQPAPVDTKVLLRSNAEICAPSAKKAAQPNLVHDEATLSVKVGTATDESRPVPWLKVGLHVNILDSILWEGRYFRRVGVVQRLLADGWAAEVAMHDEDMLGDVLQLDQVNLGTVVEEGHEVVVVMGIYLGCRVRVCRRLDGGDYEVEIEADPCMRGHSRKGHCVVLPPTCLCSMSRSF